MPRIALALVEHAADVVVVTEYRRTTGGQIRGVLSEHGWAHQLSTEPGARANGILIASRSPVEPAPPGADAPARRDRWAEVTLPELGFSLAGVHVPDGSDRAERVAYWSSLVAVARRRRAEPFLMIGDFNTGRHGIDEAGRTFTCAGMMGRLSSFGFVDAWRSRHADTREFTWFSGKRNGFRLDHAFISRPLAGRLSSAWYSHSERESGLSDHSVMVVGLDGAPG